MKRFDNKVALVTGAGSGIGQAVARAMARDGARVVVADIAESGEQTVKLITADGGQASFFQCDVQDAEWVASLVAHAVQQFGRLDIAVNNAAIDPEVAPEPAWDLAMMERIVNINLKGVYYCLKYEIEQMLTQGGGSIVNVASAAGLVGVPNKPAYTATKHAVVGLTKSSALHYARNGISINAVCPGAVDTPMLSDNLPEAGFKQVVAENHPIGRMATSDDVTRAILWMCSADSAYVTGQALAVDGGLTVQ